MNNNVDTLRRVAACDAAGEHDEAVNILAIATQTGDLAAMTMLGKRLLVGDRAPCLPGEGAGMVLEAANKGFAEAIAQVAVFQCLGIYQPKSWQHCINTLTWAARRGWLPAREQLLLLHGFSAAAAAGKLQLTDDGFWQQLGLTLDVSAWFSPGQGDTLSAEPRVQRFGNFLPLNVCELLISQASRRLKPALVYDAAARRDVRDKTRTNYIAQFNLVQNEVVHFLLQEKMSAACGVPMLQMEATAILNYKPGQEISNHYDFVDPDFPGYQQEIADNGQRIITFLVYLNDNYAGGETAFPLQGFEHKGTAGEGLYFVNALPDGAPDLRMLHAGKPPLTGEKWIVSQFIRNRPVKYIDG